MRFPSSTYLEGVEDRAASADIEDVPSLADPESPASVLVIEDDALLGPLIAQMLESVGYTVTLTSDGDDAIAAVRAERFDLALADLVLLGGEDGHEVARRLGGIQPDLRVIVMSGYGVSRYGPNHNDPILSKPFTVGQLVERIELVLAD